MDNIEKINYQKLLKDMKEMIIKCLIDKNIPVKKVILFGSRARKDFNKESDYDLLILLNKSLDPMEKKEIWLLVKSLLHKYYKTLSFDIIVKSFKTYEIEKKIVNTISNETYLEGIEL